MATNTPGTNAASSTRDVAPQRRTERLESWKEIAAYIRKDVRTAQRYEKKHSLPIHRHEQTGAVYALKFELDAWLNSDRKRDAERDDAVSPEPAPPPDPRPIVRQILIASAILAGVAGLGYRVKQILSGDAPSSPARLVVVPFNNLTDDPKLDYLARGISDDVVSAFGKLQSKNIVVVERVTAERYKLKPLEQIGRDLHPDYVVEGSVRREGERVHMNARLLQVSDQTQVWSDSYDDPAQNLSTRPAEIAAVVEGEVGKRVSAQSHSLFPGHPFGTPPPRPKIGTRNAKAYDDFLHGRYFWSKRGVDSMSKGMSYFKAAISEDPNFAPAYAGLADGLALLGSAQSGMLPPMKAFPEARSAAEKALSLDESLPEAHTSLAYISLVYDHDLSRAKREFERAIQLDPSYPTAHQWLGLYYDAIGDTKSAIESVRRAKDRDSLSLAVNIALAESYYFARDYEHAAEQAKAAVELDNTSALAHYNLGRVYLMQSLYPEAISEFKQARASSANAATLVPIGYAYGRSGNAQEARRYRAEVEQLSKSQYVPAIYFAMIYAGLNDKDQAFKWLDSALKERCDYLVFLRQDPMADTLRDDPRFAELIRRIQVVPQT